MNPSTPLQRLRQAWAERSPRERQMLLTCALVVAIGALIALADWTIAERKRLARALPRAAAELAQAQHLADELARLRQRPAAEPPRFELALDAARGAARSRGLTLELERRGEQIAINGLARPDALFDWLASLSAEWRLYPSELALHTQPDGQLRVEGLLGMAESP